MSKNTQVAGLTLQTELEGCNPAVAGLNLQTEIGYPDLQFAAVGLQVEILPSTAPTIPAVKILVLEYQRMVQAEAGTDEVSIKITDHDLNADDFIVNVTRRATTQLSGERGSRKVYSVIDENTLELFSGIAGQAEGDSIQLYKFIDRTDLLKTKTLNLKKVAEGKNSANFDFILGR